MKPRLHWMYILFLLLPITAWSAQPVTELEWDALIPENFKPEKIMEKYGEDAADLDDSDPRAQKMLAELEEAWRKAPVVKDLDGKRVKLPGFVVPLEGDGKTIREFLLVPYYGACIHVPPPPANQTVYVQVPNGDAHIREAFDTVWVTGVMSAKPFTSDLATAGYQIEAESVTPYE